MRIAIKGKKVFNKISESLAKGLQLNSEDMENITKKENGDVKIEDDEDDRTLKTYLMEDSDKQKKVIDNYGNVAEANEKTLEALIYYLGIPNDKLGIIEAMKAVNETGAKPRLIRQ